LFLQRAVKFCLVCDTGIERLSRCIKHFDISNLFWIERFGLFFAFSRTLRSVSERWDRVIRGETKGGKRQRYREGGPGQQVGNFQAQLNLNKLGDASRQWERTGVSSQLSVWFARCQFLDKNKTRSLGDKKNGAERDDS